MDGTDEGRFGYSSVVSRSVPHVGKRLEGPPAAAELEAPGLLCFPAGRP